MSAKKPVAEIDLDGTVAAIDRRIAHAMRASGGKKNRTFWQRLFDPALIREDAVVPGAKRGVRALVRDGYDVQYVSGRKNSPAVRRATVEWLRAKGFPNPTKVHLRPKNELTSNFKARTAKRLQPKLVVDDMPFRRAPPGARLVRNATDSFPSRQRMLRAEGS